MSALSDEEVQDTIFWSLHTSDDIITWENLNSFLSLFDDAEELRREIAKDGLGCQIYNDLNSGLSAK